MYFIEGADWDETRSSGEDALREKDAYLYVTCVMLITAYLRGDHTLNFEIFSIFEIIYA